jgi:thiosulfate/3-mercaptopyruvate sulfurtransferase
VGGEAPVTGDVVVSTEWVAHQLDRAGVRIIEASMDEDAYGSGHIPGALAIDWKRELIPNEDESSGDVIDPHRFAGLARRLGVLPGDTLVFYGDQGGRHAARALWTFEYYKHSGPLHWMDGGREKWARENRPLTVEPTPVIVTDYPVPVARDESIRVTKNEIGAGLAGGSMTVLDVRTQEEYDGKDVRAARGGHIPGATHIFWEDALSRDKHLRSTEELERLYASVPRDRPVAVHCQLGVRAAHTWLVLRHVLGYPDVRNYDGSWQEWGNDPETAIE